MKLSSRPPLHLTYCLNIHPGETWAENAAAVRDHALRVRRTVAPDRAFGLGLRLSRRAAQELGDPAALAAFRDFLAANDLYVFTINGFPYGPFHGTAVKQDVYRPDWRSAARRDYTIGLIDILAALLPEGVPGSISTVPVAYRPWIRGTRDLRQAARMLGQTAAHAAKVRRDTGADICVALEPEPDCYVERTGEAIDFLARALPDGAEVAGETLRRHVGVCLDTAHAAVAFEDLGASLEALASAQVRVGKIQLSAALRLRPTAAALRRLGDFADAVYLHQVKLRRADGQIESFPDLPEAIAAGRHADAARAELRVHFHVPLFFTEAGGLGSTAAMLDEGFWRRIASPSSAPTEHLEIETYTFDVLPDALRAADVAESIRREYEWVLARAMASV